MEPSKVRVSVFDVIGRDEWFLQPGQNYFNGGGSCIRIREFTELTLKLVSKASRGENVEESK